jgi:UDP-glucose:(heptosyl)LPS alpha-1,3-glucosyltransferase
MCLSKSMAEYARKNFSLPPDHLISLPNAIDLAPFDPTSEKRPAARENLHIPPTAIAALLVGHNWKLKGLHEAITALAQLQNPHAFLVIAGRDDPAPYRHLAEKLGVIRQIVFAGEVADPRPLYAAADYFLLPTRRDTFSRVVMEAMAMGLPVITTPQNGAADIIESGKQGLIVDSGDVPALATAMRTMLNPDQRQSMSRVALALRTTMSLEHHVETLERVYREVIEARKAKAGATP